MKPTRGDLQDFSIVYQPGVPQFVEVCLKDAFQVLAFRTNLKVVGCDVLQV